MWWLVTKAALTNGNSGFVSRVQIRAWKLWSQIIWPRVTIASANTRWAKDALARIHECPRISTQNVAETPQVDYSSILRTHGIRRHFGRRVWKKMKKIKSRRMPFQQLSSITKPNLHRPGKFLPKFGLRDSNTWFNTLHNGRRPSTKTPFLTITIPLETVSPSDTGRLSCRISRSAPESPGERKGSYACPWHPGCRATQASNRRSN